METLDASFLQTDNAVVLALFAPFVLTILVVVPMMLSYARRLEPDDRRRARVLQQAQILPTLFFLVGANPAILLLSGLVTEPAALGTVGCLVGATIAIVAFLLPLRDV